MKTLVSAAVLAASFAVLAEEAHKPTAAEQAMMEKYMKAATPGPEHAAMAKMAGKWKMTVTSWPAPGAPPAKSEGTSEYTSILGGRFLQQTAKGSMEGQPFEGQGLSGFDNVTKEAWGTWVDSMGTGLMTMKGKCPLTSKSCTMKGTMADPVSGKILTASTTMTMKDENNFVWEMTAPGPGGGKPFKMMQIDYVRAP